MGLWSRVVDLLSRGDAPEPDPDESVEVALVPLAEGPLTVVALQERGIAAVMVEAFDVATALTRGRIMVPRRQLEEASDIVAHLH